MTPEEQNAMRQELLELHFDCHPDPDALRARLARDPELAELDEQVRATAGLLEVAALASAPADLAFTPPIDTPRRRHPMLVAACVLWAMVVVVPLAMWGWATFRLDVEQRTQLRLVLSGPSGVPDAAPARFHAETWAQGTPTAAALSWRVLDEAGQELAAGDADSDGALDIDTPAELNGPRTIEVVARAESGATQTAQLTLRPAPDAPLAHLATDKPAYRPGETVRMRAVVLDRLTLEPRADNLFNFRVADPKGAAAIQHAIRSSRGVAASQWTIPADAAGGEYAFELRDPNNSFAFERQTFLVRRYQPPRLQKQIDLDRATYAPGTSGTAEIRVVRAAGGAAAGAQLDANLILDGQQVWSQQVALDGDGRAIVAFEIPAEVERGEARLVARITDGGVVETQVEPFVVPTGAVEVAFSPEGGELVADVHNRVYAEVTDPLGRPLSARGRVVDQGGRAVATFETEHQGRARFAMVPRAGERYRLELDEPVANPIALPTAIGSGVVLSTVSESTAVGEPLRLTVHTPNEGPWIVGAFLRGTLVGQDAFEGGGRHDVSLSLPASAAGVLRVTAFDRHMLPVAERLVHRASGRRIDVDVGVAHPVLAPGASQSLTLSARDESGTPVAAMLGVTVTDRAVRDMVGETRVGLADQTWLCADVEDLEEVEEFVGGGPEAAHHIDLLLGTRGWRRFLWAKSSDLAALTAEHGDRFQRLVLREGHGQAPAIADVAPQLGALRRSVSGARDVLLGVLGGSVVLLAIVALALAAGRLRRGPVVTVGLTAGAAAALLIGLAWITSQFAGTPLMFEGLAAPEAAAAAPPAAGGAPVKVDLVAAEPLDALNDPLAVDFYARDFDVEEANGAMFLRGAKAGVNLAANLELIAQFQGLPNQEFKRLADREVALDEFMMGRSFRVHRAQPYAHRFTAGESRRDFTETLCWNPSLETSPTEPTVVTFDTSDRVTTWSVWIDAHGERRVGQAAGTFDTRLPLAIEPLIPAEVSQGDRLRLPVSIVAEDAAEVAIRARATGALTLAGPASQDVALIDGRGRAIVELTVGGPAADTALEVDARAGRFTDRVRRDVRVVPRGFPHHFTRSGVLREEIVFDVQMPQSAVRGSMASVLKLFPSPLANLSDGMQGILQEPHGCFEQASSSNYPNVMLLSFLDATGKSAPAQARQARSYLDKGYRLLTGYECGQRGFEWFGHDPGHEALSAYGLLEFSDMAQVFAVGDDLLERTRGWLLDRRDGRGGYRHDPKALDSFGRAPAPVTDAYVTYALAASGTPAATLAEELDHLAGRVAETGDAYELAVAACALAAAGRDDAATAARRRLVELQAADGSLTGSSTSITASRGRDLTVETTSFAVLAWLPAERHRAQVEQAVRYLLEQRQGSGTFGATQATIMALKALTEHARLNNRAATPGMVQVWINGKLLVRRGFTADQQEPILFEDLHQVLHAGDNRVRLVLTGDNEFPWTFDLGYHAEQPANDPDCAVALETRLAANSIREGETVSLMTRVRNRTDEGLPMTMAIIGLPAGLHAPHQVLDDLREAGRFDLWELRGRELILYWRDLAPGAAEEVHLDLVGRVPGDTRGPASRAYLYYTPGAKIWAPPLEVSVR